MTVFGWGLTYIDTPRAERQNVLRFPIEELPIERLEGKREPIFTVFVMGKEYDEFINNVAFDIWQTGLSGPILFPLSMMTFTGEIRNTNGRYFMVVDDLDNIKLRSEVTPFYSPVRMLMPDKHAYIDIPLKESSRYKGLLERNIIVQISGEESYNQKTIKEFHKDVALLKKVQKVELRFGVSTLQQYKDLIETYPNAEKLIKFQQGTYLSQVIITVANQKDAEVVARKIKEIDYVDGLIKNPELDIQYHKR